MRTRAVGAGGLSGACPESAVKTGSELTFDPKVRGRSGDRVARSLSRASRPPFVIAMAAAVVVTACTRPPDVMPDPTPDPSVRRLPNGGVIWERGRQYWLPPGALIRVVDEGRRRGRPEHAADVIEHAIVLDFDLYDPYCAEADYQWKHVSAPEMIQCAVPYQQGLVVVTRPDP